MKKYKFTIKGHDYEVEILSYEHNIVEMEVNGTHYVVEVQQQVKSGSKTPRLVRAAVPKPRPHESGISKAADQQRPVKTPLPGTVLKVLVQAGDQVKQGQTLLIMEAMKMENNVSAERDGKVVEVKVKEGDTVLQNDVLLVLE